MARKKTVAPPVQQGPEFVGKTPPAMAASEEHMNLAIREAAGNAQALAEQLGYEGALTVGSLEDEIRFYQRRTVEASLELGKRLMLLKEITPHGEFGQRIELLGISQQMGRKFMMATLKFSKRSSTSVLTAAGTQTKLLELLVLDEDEIAELEDGGSARGIELDDVATMTVTELRSALREGREEQKATERVLEEKNKKLDELAKKGRRKSADPWPDEVAGLKDDLHGLGKVLDEALGKHLTLVDATEIEIGKYADGETNPDALTGYKTVVHHLGEQIERICTLAAGLRAEFETRLSGYVDLDKTHILPD
ncbi:MAG: hypothetical protein PHY45_11825 [Rhodocyclaceae bacterium]|nr:hypothetical protein [Rhodocyclaceae bacterium]